jgi:excisionase family DNA binding protein
MADARRLLSSAEVGQMLGVSARTVCLWAECSNLPGFKVGRQWRFRSGDLDRWLDKVGGSEFLTAAFSEPSAQLPQMRQLRHTVLQKFAYKGIGGRKCAVSESAR